MTGKPKNYFLSAPLSSSAGQKPDIFDCANRVQLLQSIGDTDVSPSSHVTANSLPSYLEALTASLSILAALFGVADNTAQVWFDQEGGAQVVFWWGFVTRQVC